jgi:hypothetical protein
MSAAQLEVVIDIVHLRVALRTGIWQHALAVSAARRPRPQPDLAVALMDSVKRLDYVTF